MSVVKLVLAGLRQRPATWAFHALLLAVAVGITLAVGLVRSGAGARIERDLAGVDLVVGAPGSPMQLILSTLLASDAPTGNIPLQTLERLERDPLVSEAVPVSLGDSIGDIRIVGTTPAYGELYGAGMGEGRWWTGSMQAVLGADAARRLGLGIGDTFTGAHGFGPSAHEHAGHPYTVVGILEPTGSVADRLALTSLESVWDLHAPHEEASHEGEAAHADEEHAHAHEGEAAGEAHAASDQITAVLVRYRSPLAAVTLAPRLGREPGIQAASPAREAQRLNALIGDTAGLLERLGQALLALAGIGFVIALGAAVLTRRREIALLKALGAGPGLLARYLLLEGALLGLAGGLVGVGLGRALVGFIAASGATPVGIAAPAIGGIDALLLGGSVALGLLATLPALIVALRIDPARTLESQR